MSRLCAHGFSISLDGEWPDDKATHVVLTKRTPER